LPVSQTRHEAPVADDTESDIAEADDDDVDTGEDAEDDTQDRVAGGAGETSSEEGERKRKRRRRRRGRGNRPEDGADAPLQSAPVILDGTEQPDFGHIEFPGAKPVESIVPVIAAAVDTVGENTAPASTPEETPTKARGKRGGRRRAAPKGQAAPTSEAQRDLPPYAGPTPADPFANGGMDIFDLMDMAEARQIPPPPAAIQMSPQVSQTPQQPVAATIAILEAPPPAAPEPDPEPIAGPVIKPMLIDGSESVAGKKKGWWRR
jgi:ribonuclease E